jgi:integrase
MKSYASALVHLDNFIAKEYPGYDSSSIIDLLVTNKINVYQLLDSFISYIQKIRPGMTPKSVRLYITALKSYFGYNDIDIIPTKFKRKVMIPKVYRDPSEAIDAADLRTILLACSNRRLKSYLLVLGSSGARAVEALAIRNKDIDFSTSPTTIRLRKEYSKIKLARTIYISDEATHYLKQFLEWKYNNPEKPRKFNDDDLVFTVFQNVTSPKVLYQRIWFEFQKLLTTVKFDKRKESGIKSRRQISLRSIRSMVKTIVATQTNSDYSEFTIGHLGSVYWSMKESERAEIFNTKVMPFVTYLDYSALENSSRGIVTQLENKDKEIAYLRERDVKHELELKAMNERLEKLDRVVNKIDKLEKELGITK